MNRNIQRILSFIQGIVGTRGIQAEQVFQERMLWQQKSELAALRYETRRNWLSDRILLEKEMGTTPEKYAAHDVIVSLTSYGKRIYDVALTIESIMQQSMKTNRIILWLDDSFKGANLPPAIIKQQKRGLEIMFCKDIRSYTKLIPALRQFPSHAIVTIDDDALYDCNMMAQLISAYQGNPNQIHCCRAHRMLFDDDRHLLPYNSWMHDISEAGVHLHNFFTGVGGVLYPPHCFDDEVLAEGNFLNICPDADDVWFNAMAIKKGTPVNKVFTPPYREVYLMNEWAQDTALSITNVGEMKNDVQIQAVFNRYSLYDKLLR